MPDGYEILCYYPKTINICLLVVLSSRDVKVVPKTEYKKFVDQSVELYRLKDKVNELEKMEQSLKVRLARMENTIKEKATENKTLRNLLTFYKKENAKLENNCGNQSVEVSY